MTRKQAQEWLLYHINEQLATQNENDIIVECPGIGKNSWTYAEYKHAVENDTCLEGSNTNPIDDALKYHEYLEKFDQSCFKHD